MTPTTLTQAICSKEVIAQAYKDKCTRMVVKALFGIKLNDHQKIRGTDRRGLSTEAGKGTRHATILRWWNEAKPTGLKLYP